MSDAAETEAKSDRPYTDPTASRPQADPVGDFFRSLEETMPALWYAKGIRTERPYPAIVVEVAGTSVTLHIFDPKFSRAKRVNVSGVRWIGDPEATQIDRDQQGAFDLPAWLRRVMAETKTNHPGQLAKKK